MEATPTIAHSRHRVDQLALIKRMAPQQTLDPQPPPSTHAIFFNGFHHIMRTGRIENTIFTEQGGDHDLIKADEFDDQVAHLISPGFLAQQMRPPEQAGASGVHLMIISTENRTPGNQYNIPPRLDHRHSQPDRFTQTTLQPITNDSASDPSIDRKPKPAIRQLVGQRTQHQKFATVRFTLLTNLLEAFVFLDAVMFLHAAKQPRNSLRSSVVRVNDCCPREQPCHSHFLLSIRLT
jgi:hypothetical protein